MNEILKENRKDPRIFFADGDVTIQINFGEEGVVQGQLLNISASGACFAIDYVPESFSNATLILSTTDGYYFTIKVVKRWISAKSSRVGVEFHYESPGDLAQIQSFVFRTFETLNRDQLIEVLKRVFGSGFSQHMAQSLTRRS